MAQGDPPPTDHRLGPVQSGEPREDDYREHVAETARARVRPLSLVLVLIVLLDGTYEAVARPDTFSRTFWTRAAAVAVCAFVYFATRARRSHRAMLGLATLLVFAVAADIEKAVVAASGHGSAFFTGLALVIAAAGLLFPFDVGATLLLSAIVWVVFLAPLVTGMQVVDPKMVGDQAFFLVCSTLIAVMGSRVTGRLRRSEFQHGPGTTSQIGYHAG